MSGEETCGKLLRRVADWDVPGNIRYEAFHKPKTTATDSAVPARRKPGSPPGPPTHRPPSPEVPGVRGGHRGVGRSDYPPPVVSTDVPLQDPGVGPDTVWQGTSLHPVQEVGVPLTRRSSRHRSNVVKFQAGSSGMEHT